MPEEWDATRQGVAAWLQANAGRFPRHRSGNDEERRLGDWVRRQRLAYGRGTLSAERVESLEAIYGWAWNGHDAKWNAHLRQLRHWLDTHEGTYPRTSSGPREEMLLGTWIHQQQLAYGNAGTYRLDARRIAALEDLPGWAWKARDLPRPTRERVEPDKGPPVADVRWSETYLALLAWLAAHPGIYPPASSSDPETARLGRWINTQRTRRDQLSLDRQARLERLPGWVWAVHPAWGARLNDLIAWLDNHNGTYPRRDGRDTTPAERSLNEWVSHQRSRHRRPSGSALTGEQIAQLETLPRWRW